MENIKTYDKPFKTISEQIDILTSRNIVIEDNAFATQILSSLSYYTIINGYKNSFLSIAGTDSFAEGTKFEELYTLHILDTSLSSIIFKNILYIERYLKTRISYLMSEKYGVYTDYNDFSNMNPKDYLFSQNYSRSNGRKDSILRKLKKTITSDRKNAIMEHYLDTKNHIPPWILVTNIPFGLTIEWYGIMTNDDKAGICNQFINSSVQNVNDKKELFNKSLYLLKEYRNNIAHGNRTFNTLTKSKLPWKLLFELSKGTITKLEYNSKSGQNDLFAVMLSILILIDDKYILRNFYSDLAYTLLPYEGILVSGKTIFETFNLPNDILDRIKSYITE